MGEREFERLLAQIATFNIKDRIVYLEKARMQFWNEHISSSRQSVFEDYSITRFLFVLHPIDNELDRLYLLLPQPPYELLEVTSLGRFEWRKNPLFYINEPSQTDETSPHQNPKESNYENFEKLFFKEADISLTFQAMQKIGIVNDCNQWNYGNRKGAIVAVIDVLKARTKIKFLPDAKLAYLLASKIGTSIGERTTRDRPQYYDDIVRELTALIK